jgi:hypothetical protein
MSDNALVRVPVLESRPSGLVRAMAAVWERLWRREQTTSQKEDK